MAHLMKSGTLLTGGSSAGKKSKPLPMLMRQQLPPSKHVAFISEPSTLKLVDAVRLASSKSTQHRGQRGLQWNDTQTSLRLSGTGYTEEDVSSLFFARLLQVSNNRAAALRTALAESRACYGYRNELVARRREDPSFEVMFSWSIEHCIDDLSRQR